MYVCKKIDFVSNPNLPNWPFWPKISLFHNLMARACFLDKNIYSTRESRGGCNLQASIFKAQICSDPLILKLQGHNKALLLPGGLPYAYPKILIYKLVGLLPKTNINLAFQKIKRLCFSPYGTLGTRLPPASTAPCVPIYLPTRTFLE